MLDVRRNAAKRRVALRKVKLSVVGLCLAAALGACGGGGDDSAAPVAQNPSQQSPPQQSPPQNALPAGNQAPTISGTPSAQAMQGQQYSFTPTATDPDGNTLAFAITNAPAWATFNGTTGQLSGTPTSAQIGTFADIRISVSDGTATTELTPFAITVVGTATGSATLTWNPPTQNTDGSALSNLAGYKVYWGTSQDNYPNSVTLNNPGLSSYVVDQLTPATWYFVITAVNSAGSESGYSNVASKQVL